jgi:D-alanyl-D-alanine carboxypeptidase/D-alanyl-D-alanine-endopeptidase (penicillin-binding protein 4)
MKFRLILVVAITAVSTAYGQPLRQAADERRQAADELTQAVELAVQDKLFSRTLAAIEIRDLENGSILYSRNAGLLLRPASNAKLVTSAAAVLGLPESFRFRTLLLAKDSSMRSLVCAGGADPLFTSQDIQKLVDIAYATGLRRLDTLFLDGGLLDDAFFGAGWMWDDEADPFMPYLSAFPLDGNTAEIRVKSPAQSGQKLEVTVFPSSELLRVENEGRSGKGGRLRVDKRPRSNDIVISGSLATGRRSTKRVSLWRPQDVFADLFLTACRELGIQVDSTIVLQTSEKSDGAQIAEVSHSLPAVLDRMNKDSDNLCAESVLRMLSAPGRTRGISAEDGLAAMRRILEKNGISTDAMQLRDGSGISFYSLLTAEFLGQLLAVMARHPRFEAFASTLSVAGNDGTLARRMKELEKGAVFRGKTGTVSGVSALSGYAQAPGGRLLGVVILMQNFHGKHAPYRKVQDEIVRLCMKYSAAGKAATRPR